MVIFLLENRVNFRCVDSLVELTVLTIDHTDITAEVQAERITSDHSSGSIVTYFLTQPV